MNHHYLFIQNFKLRLNICYRIKIENLDYRFYLIDDQIIDVTDSGNHWIIEWKNSVRNSQIIIGGNMLDHQDDQLNYPVDDIVDKKREERNCPMDLSFDR